MHVALRYIICAWIIATVHPALLRADQIILHSGETFDSPRVWEVQDKIRFDLNGLTVSVKKEEVRAIIHSRNTSETAGAKVAPVSRRQPDEPLSAVDKPVDERPLADKPEPSPKASQTPSPVPMTRSIKGTGLQGVIWRSSPSAMSGLVKIKTESEYGGIDQYHRPDDPLRIGRARLDGMAYGFWRNQLYTVMLWVEGRPGYRILKETIRAHYGSGQPSTSGQERYVWKDRDTDRLLEFDDQLNTGIFWMRSRSLDAEIKRLYPE